MNAEPIPLRPTEDELLEARVIAARGLIAAGFDVLTLWSTALDGTCRCPKGAGCESKPGKHPIAPAGTWNVTHDPVAAETMLRAGSRPNLGVIPPVGAFAWDVDGDAPALLERPRHGRLTCSDACCQGRHRGKSRTHRAAVTESPRPVHIASKVGRGSDDDPRTRRRPAPGGAS